jgi:hypothetical protein
LKEQTIEQQRAKLDTYIALATQGLPIPLDLKAEVESVLVHGAGAGGGMPEEGGGGMAGGPQQKPGGIPGVTGPGGAPELGPPGAGGGINMPPPPPGLGAGPGTAPPGGGTPAATPTAPGPPGTVPQVSNERRPGLKYNTHNVGGRLAGREGSDLDQFLSDYPDLGLPFVDYVGDNTDVDDLNDVGRDTLLSLSKTWPKEASAYQHRVAEEVKVYLANTPDPEPESAKVEPSVEFKLKVNQELRKDEEKGSESIIETSSKKRIKFKAATDKKYTVVDPAEKPIVVTPKEAAKLREAYYKANKIPLPKDADTSESTEPESS